MDREPFFCPGWALGGDGGTQLAMAWLWAAMRPGLGLVTLPDTGQGSGQPRLGLALAYDGRGWPKRLTTGLGGPVPTMAGHGLRLGRSGSRAGSGPVARSRPRVRLA